MKKETRKIAKKLKKDGQGLSDYILNGYKIPKGFKEYNTRVNMFSDKELCIEKSIYDKRMVLLTTFIVDKLNREEIEYTEKIIHGGFDE